MTPTAHHLISSKRFALACAVVTFLLALVVGEVLIDARQREAGNERYIATVSQAAMMRARIERELNTLLYLNSGLASYLEVRNYSIDGKELGRILASLHQRSRHVRNFGIAIGYRLTHVYPVAGNERAVGVNYQDLPAQWPAIKSLVDRGQPALTGPVNLVQGGRGLIYRIPLFVDRQYWGLLSTVIDPDSLVRAAFDNTDQSHYSYALRGKEGPGTEGNQLFGEPGLFSAEGAVVQEIDIPGGRWAIAVLPQAGESSGHSFLGARLAMWLLGSLLAWMLYTLMRDRAELARLVMFDTLTGLPNRRLLDDRVQMAFARQLRQPDHVCALLFLDLDGFKRINDEHGHDAGDALLRQTAQRAVTTVRGGDTVARWGGDEFIVLLENIFRRDLDEFLKRLRDIIEAPVDFEGQALRVGVSIGVALYPDDGPDLDSLLQFADQEMYVNKSSRKSGDSID